MLKVFISVIVSPLGVGYSPVGCCQARGARVPRKIEFWTRLIVLVFEYYNLRTPVQGMHFAHTQ